MQRSKTVDVNDIRVQHMQNPIISREKNITKICDMLFDLKNSR